MLKSFFSLIIAMCILFLSGCTNIEVPLPSSSPDANNDSKAETTDIEKEVIPVEGGTLKVPIPEPDTLNPLLTNSASMLNFLHLIFESVVDYDKNLKAVPSLATDWEISPDGRIWIFNLRKNVKWHNGTDFTGNDVLFTFNALKSGLLNSYFQTDIYENENIVEIGLRNDDPYSIYIRLNEPDSNILDIMTFPVLPENIYGNPDAIIHEKNDLSIIPIGTGPYMVKSNAISDDGSLQLQRNDDWWSSKKPYIDSILVKTYDSNESAREAFKQGEVDLVDTNIVYIDSFLSTMDASQYKYLTQSFEFLAINNKSPILTDNDLRKAIAYAIDRKDIVSKVYLNNAETVDVPIPSFSWLYDNSSRIYDYDPEKAIDLLHDSGWSDSDDDGILDKLIDGKKTDLTFTILTNSENDFRREVLDLLVDDLKAVGIKCIPQVVKWDQLQEEYIKTLEYDALLTGYTLGYNQDLSFALNSSKIGEDGLNITNYESTEMDSLLQQSLQEYGDEELKTYKEIQKLFIDDLPFISLYFCTGSLLVNNNIKGIGQIIELDIYNGIENWFISN